MTVTNELTNIHITAMPEEDSATIRLVISVTDPAGRIRATVGTCDADSGQLQGILHAFRMGREFGNADGGSTDAD